MKDNIVNGICLSIGTVFTLVQTNEILRTISIILTAMSAAVAFAYNIYKWYKKAKSDGKISKEELNEAVDIIKDGIDVIKKEIDKDE